MLPAAIEAQMGSFTAGWMGNNMFFVYVGYIFWILACYHLTKTLYLLFFECQSNKDIMFFGRMVV